MRTKTIYLKFNKKLYSSDTLKKAAYKFSNRFSHIISENKDEYVIENVCYKEDSKIPIIEESAKLQIAKKLVENGKKVTIKDEIQLINEVKKEYGNLFSYIII